MMYRLSKLYRYCSELAWCLAAFSAAGSAIAQCNTYAIAPSPATYITGTTNVAIADTDEGSASIALPFPVSLYGNSYTSLNVDINGYLEFAGVEHSYTVGCLPTTELANPTIFAYWDDLFVFNKPGYGVFTAESGSPGSRTFAIEWRGLTSWNSSADQIDFEVIFTENQSYFDIIYHTITGSSSAATIGVQQSPAGPSTSYSTCASAAVGSGVSLRFSCATSVVNGTCCFARQCTLVAEGACDGVFTPNAVCSPNPCPLVPTNDDCGAAVRLSDATLPYGQSIDNAYATDDTSSCGTVYKGVWFTFTAPSRGYLTFVDSNTETLNPAIAVWSVAVDCNTTPACIGDDKSERYYELNANQTVKILVGYAASGSQPTIHPTIGFTAAAPNDNCSNAVDLNAVQLPYSATVDLFATNPSQNIGCDYTYDGVWYTYTPTWTGYLGFSRAVAHHAAVWATSSDCSSPGTCFYYETPSSQGFGSVPITAGQTINVLVASQDDLTAPDPAFIDFGLAPDDCEVALPVSVPGSVQGNLIYATPTPFGVSGVCAVPNGLDFWYSVAIVTGGRYQFQLTPTDSGNVPIAISLFSSCPGNGGNQLACTSSTTVSTLQQSLTPGTYIVRVACDGNRTFQLDISAASCPADFDGNSTVNVSDIFAFLRAWFAHSSTADIDGNLIVNVSDIFAFLRHWFGHC